MSMQLDSVVAQHPSARESLPAALRSLSLRVAEGEQVAIIGPSGAGKTTLLQVMACALRPAAGELHWGDCSPWKLPTTDLQRLRRQLFLAPQVPPLPPRQRVVTAALAGRLPDMGLFASLASLVHPRELQAVADALARFDLEGKLFERVDRLSGGERQRVGLARALLSSARLWLVDEPLSSLDPSRARLALATLTQLARERGATLVATLHQVDAALSGFPRIVGLREGQLAFDLPSDEVTPELLKQLYQQPGDGRPGEIPFCWGRVALPDGSVESAPAAGAEHGASEANSDDRLREGFRAPPVLLQCR